ncbi:MAG: aminopeptidase P family protein [Halioglobus sp.]
MGQRLEAVRALMSDAGLDAFIVPRADEYLGEYIPAHNERLKWITGFNGSAGVAIILAHKAAIFVDGRYTVQVRQEVSTEFFEIHQLIEEPHVEWLQKQLQPGATIAYDPRLHSLAWQRSAVDVFRATDQEMRALNNNIIDRCWIDRPAPIIQAAILQGLVYTGESSVEKRRRIGADIAARNADVALIFAPDSVSWLLNIRGTDIPCLPVVQSFAMLSADGSLVLFADPDRIPEGFDEHVGPGVEVLPETSAQEVFVRYSGMSVLGDAQGANAWTQLALIASGATLIDAPDPVLLPKACKNSVEVQGARNAHIRDAVAEIRFLAWLDDEVGAGRLHDEAALSDQLLSYRQSGAYFQDLSFDTISAAGENAAMCHYNHLNGTPAQLPMNSVYLVDSGAQYFDGTTDITRTVAIGDPGDDVRHMYTLVLKGHIALAQAQFPHGTTGTQLDVLARQFLWQEGFDYDHGTGHGVGSFLSVHEAPQRISKASSSVALCEGMIISNEPGYYRDGGFGIRCENLVVVRTCSGGGGDRAMLDFETITLVPFDNRLLLPSLLNADEIDWLNNYHDKVRETLAPLLDDSDRRWLEQATVHV